MKVSIIILNWNGGEFDCVESVESALRQDYINKEIIFVDNGSTDGSYEAIVNKFPDLMHIQTGANLGCPEGRNVGASNASGDIIAFLENDGSWKESNVVSEAVKFMESNTNIAALYIGVEGYESNKMDPPVDIINTSVKKIQLSSTFRGGASFIWKKLFYQCGGFPGDFLRQCEEMFLSYILVDKGYDIVYWPEKILRHKGSDYEGKSDVVMCYTYVNELKTIIRLFPNISLFYYIPGKILINSLRFIRNKKFIIFIKLTIEGVLDVRHRSKYRKISIKGLKRFNHIKYNPLNYKN